MADLTRRHLLGTAAAGGALALAGGTAAQAATRGSVAAPAAAAQPDILAPASVIGAGDPRYAYLTRRGYNHRYNGTPTDVHQVFTAGQAVRAVQQAVDAGRRIAVRSGGHCLADLVDSPDVTALIDLSELNSVGYDPLHQAISVGAGALQGDVYKATYLAYGVVHPGGLCPTVGMGGFVAGGGFGLLSRKHGLIVDHLQGVEVVTVDASGQAQLTLATRDPGDPDHDLWWGHTGAGGGNFGVVTRYLLRDPAANPSAGPGAALPKPPPAVLTATVIWPWAGMTEAAFTRLVTNHGQWHAANSAPGTPYESLYSEFALLSKDAGVIVLVAEIDATLPDAQQLMNSYLGALGSGVGAPSNTQTQTLNWLTHIYAEMYPGPAAKDNRSQSKSAYLRRPFTADQIGTLYQRLSNPGINGTATVIQYAYGAQINTVGPADTAVPQRDSVLKSLLITTWSDPSDDDANVQWTRTFYRDLFAATGGVPQPGAQTDGCYVNFPDPDLLDPAWNPTPTPWSTLYFKDNYARLQQVKSAYDPTNQFRHAVSIRPVGQ